MKAISEQLVRVMRRADSSARVIIEGLKVVASDILQTVDQWRDWDSAVGITSVFTGGIRLTGGTNTFIENTIGTQVAPVTDMDLDSPLEMLEITWGQDRNFREIHFLEADLIAQVNGGNPKEVAFWRAQMFRAVRRAVGADDQLTIAPVSDVVTVAATGGTTPVTTTFEFTVINYEDSPATPGDGPEDESDNPGADRDDRTRTYILIWAVKDDGTYAGNCGWDTDDASGQITSGGDIARRVQVTTEYSDRINNRGRTELAVLDPNVGDVMTFALRGKLYSTTETVSYTAADSQIDLGAAPGSATLLRVIAEGQTRSDSSITFEISPNNGTNWYEVADGDIIGEDNTPQGGNDLSGVARQQTYWRRVTLAPNTDDDVTPVARRFGVEEVEREDLDGIAVIRDEPQWQVSPETFKGEITEATIDILKDGTVDYTDWATELLATKYLNEFFFRAYIGSDAIDRKNWLHLDDFFIEDYQANPAAISFQCITALHLIRQALPVYNASLDEREVLDYGGQSLKDVSLDILLGQAEVPARNVGPGIEDEATFVTKNIEDSDAKAELDALGEIAGGGWTTSQGRIVFRSLTERLAPQYEFQEQEIGWVAVTPGYSKRVPEYFVPYSWVEQERRYDAEIRSFHGPALTNLGLARIDIGQRASDIVSQWIDQQAVAETVARRRTELQGTGLMLWEFRSIYPHPELEVGDVVRVPTDRFVAKDPNTAREIRGRSWVVGVITRVRGQWGQTFEIWVRGFDDVLPSEIDVTRKKYGTDAVEIIKDRLISSGADLGLQRWWREIWWRNLSGVGSVHITWTTTEYAGFKGDESAGTVRSESYHMDVLPSTTTREILRNVSTDSAIYSNIDGYQDLDDTQHGVGEAFTGVQQELVRVNAELRRVGDPTGEVVCRIYDDDGVGNPNNVVLTSYSVRARDIATTADDKVEFSFPSGSTITLGDDYHAVIYYPDGTATDYLRVGVDLAAGAGDTDWVLSSGGGFSTMADQLIWSLQFFEINTNEPEGQDRVDFPVNYDENRIISEGEVTITLQCFRDLGGASRRLPEGRGDSIVLPGISTYDDVGVRALEFVNRRIANFGEGVGDTGAGPNSLSMDDTANGFAWDYTPSESHDVGQVGVYLREIDGGGGAAGNVTVVIYDDSGGLPGSVLGTSDAIAAADLPLTNYSVNITKFDFPTPVSLTGGTLYHIAVEYSGGTATNYVDLAAEATGSVDELNGTWAAGPSTEPTWRVYEWVEVERFGRATKPVGDFQASLNLSTGDVEFSVAAGGGGSDHNIGDHLDTSFGTLAAGEFMRYDGANWVDTVLVAADIPTLDASKIGTGSFADARISQSSVTQHEGAINHDALSGFVAAEHIDWSVTGAEDVHVDRITAAAVTQHEGSINHDALSGFVANEHIDHSGVSITTAADSGLSGGGDLTVTRNLAVDFDNLIRYGDGTTGAPQASSVDFFAMFIAGTGSRKVSPIDIPLSLFHDDLGYTAYSAGPGIDSSALTGGTIQIDYGAGANGLFGGAGSSAITVVGTDAILVSDGGLSQVAEEVQLNTIALSVFSKGNFVESDVAETISAQWTFTSEPKVIRDGNALIFLSGGDALPTYQFAGLRLEHDESLRWLVAKNNNANGDLRFARYNDSAVFQGTALRLARADGDAFFEANVDIPGVITNATWNGDAIDGATYVNNVVKTLSLATDSGLSDAGTSEDPILAVDIENLHDWVAGDGLQGTDKMAMLDVAGDLGNKAIRIDQLDLSLMDNSVAGFSNNALETVGDGLTATGPADVQVDYGSGSGGLFGGATDGTGLGTMGTTDKLLVGTDGGLVSQTHQVNISQLPFASTSHTHGPDDITGGGTFGSGNYTFPADLTISGTGQIFAPDGLVTAPSYGFSSDSDTGMYFGTSPNQLLFAVDGVAALGFTDTFGVFAVQIRGENAASASLPDFAFIGDTDTGMFSPGANIVAFSVGGAERLRVDSNGAGLGEVLVSDAQFRVAEQGTALNAATASPDFDKGNQVRVINDGTVSTVDVATSDIRDGGSYIIIVEPATGSPKTSFTWTGVDDWVNGNEPVLTNSIGQPTVVMLLSSNGTVIGSWYQAS